MDFTLAAPFHVTRRGHQCHLALLLLVLVVAGRDAVPEDPGEVRLNIARVGFVLIILGTGRWLGPGLVIPVILVVLVGPFGVTRIIIVTNVIGIELVIPWALGKFFVELLGRFFVSAVFVTHRGSMMQ